MPDRRQRRRRAAVIGGAAVAAKKRKDERDAQQQAQQGAPPPAAEPAAPAQPTQSGGLSDEAIERLKELGKLHEQNVLTDEEFEREKAKVLGL